MHKGCVCDGRLAAVEHFERLDPAQVHEGRVRNGRLVAGGHVKRFDPA